MENRPVRILRIIARLNTGGPARHVTWVTRGLSSFGYETTLAAGRVEVGESSMEDDLRDGGHVWTTLPSLRRSIGLHDATAFLEILRLIFETDPQILHTHTAKAGFLGRAAALFVNAGRRLTGRPRIRVVHTFHGHTLRGYHGPLAEEIFLAIERFLGSFATDRIVVLSPALRRELAETFRVAPRERFTIVPLGLDLAPFDDSALAPQRGFVRKRLGLAPNVPLAGAVGRLTAIKDLPTLLAAVSRIPDHHLLLVGEGEDRGALEARASELGLAARVHFWGEEKEVGRIYADLDLLVLSSRNEGTPLSAIEAMAAGVPVVATAVGGLVDLLADGRGLLVPPGDPKPLAEAIERMTSDAPLCAETVRRARDYARTTHDLPRLLENLDRLYRNRLS